MGPTGVVELETWKPLLPRLENRPGPQAAHFAPASGFEKTVVARPRHGPMPARRQILQREREEWEGVVTVAGSSTGRESYEKTCGV
jgi:hypothetical protein